MLGLIDSLQKTDVEGLALQGRGRVVNVDEAAYIDYKNRQRALSLKDNEISNLKERLHQLESKLDFVLQALNTGK